MAISKQSFIRNSAVLYRGPSKLNGQPIVAVATGNSTNRKTGAMLQVWILSDNGLKPTEAKKSGDNASVCGVCPIKKECYVNLGQAPRSIYDAYKRGRYLDLSDDQEGIAKLVKGQFVRFGAYGDIAALPYDLSALIVAHCSGHTAYTHQRKHKAFDARLYQIAHVSAETAAEAITGVQVGFNTFRIVSDYSHKLPGEIVCPSEVGVSCLECGLCNGRKGKNIVIKAHGTSGKKLQNKLEKHSKPTESQLNLISVVNIDSEQLNLF